MTSAICNLLEHEPVNKEVADALWMGCCPGCGSSRLVRWRPGTGFHDLCTHFHCMCCDADYHWPIAWEPPKPVMKMRGELSPQDRRRISESCQRHGESVPDWWQPIMQSDLEPTVKVVTLRCSECHKEKQIEVIIQAGYWHWPQGKWPRKWTDYGDAELTSDSKTGKSVIYAQCTTHTEKQEVKGDGTDKE